MRGKIKNAVPGKPNLQERRRLLTIETIRNAAITLVVKHGLENVTIEMIAEAAGISPRTFFNYFTYKEEALIPPPFSFSSEATSAFISASGPLLDDLIMLLEERLAEKGPERAIIQVIMDMSNAHPRLQSVRESALLQIETEFQVLFGLRLGLPPEHQTSTLMAAVISASIRVALCRWIENDSSSMLEILSATLSNLPTLFANEST